MTCGPSRRSPTAGSRAPSSARRSTRDGSPCRRRWPRYGSRPAMDLDGLVAQASAILDAAAVPFLAGHRADSAVPKKGNDFATEVDLAIERQVVAALQEATGI